MTREQIEELRRLYSGCDCNPCVRQRSLCDLAERALLLEDVLDAAKELHAEWVVLSDALIDVLRAAIDRAEGK